MSVYNERLQHLGQRATQLIDTTEDLDESRYNFLYLTVVAAEFDYQVKKGGFDQLIFNLGRERLEHCHVMLTTVDAPVALSFYVRAITRCTEDMEDFNRFMADYTAPTKVAQDLTMLSIEYLRGDTSFDSEIAEFVDLAEAQL